MNNDAQLGSHRRGNGLSILAKLVLTFLVFILLLGVLLFLVYRHYVPPLIQEQIDLRAESVTRAFAAAALQPAVERNYLQINKLAEATAQLPGVAYASAINAKGIPIAGIFSSLAPFDPTFAQLVKQSGFPRTLFADRRVPKGADTTKARLSVGGTGVLDYGVRLGTSGTEVHVGLFTDDVDRAIRQSLMPLAALLAVMTVAGILAVAGIAQTVSRPIRKLAEQAEHISQGHLDREIDIDAGGEIGQLAQAFKRMQGAIRYSIVQLRKQKDAQRVGSAA